MSPERRTRWTQWLMAGLFVAGLVLVAVGIGLVLSPAWGVVVAGGEMASVAYGWERGWL